MRVRHLGLHAPDGRGGSPFAVTAFDLDPAGDRRLIQEAVARGEGIDAAVFDPSGRIRDPLTLRRTRYLGALSEILLRDHLEALLPDARVTAPAFEGHGTHVDLRAEQGERVLRIEVRGSFPYRPLDRVVWEIFDVIGPYRTSNKPPEDPRDVYLRTLVNARIGDFTVRRPHTLWFVGGAEYARFEASGRWTDFRQRGAEYLTIRPISRGRDAAGIVRWMRSALEGTSPSGCAI